MSGQIRLETGQYYHIFNRGNNGENLFNQEENYFFFLKKYHQYCARVFKTYAYCLLKNHFHLLVKVIEPDKDVIALSDGILTASEQLRRFFISYTQAINKRYKRTGSLFEKPYRRRRINSINYLNRTVRYIHFNPTKHGFTSDFREYKYSSYPDFISNNRQIVDINEVLTWFGGIDNFIVSHYEMIDNDGR